ARPAVARAQAVDTSAGADAGGASG
ncbi:glutathione S-transferase, partial [Xanthomonas oryzae pv. oryzae]